MQNCELRDYDNCDNKVKHHYKLMRKNQTISHVFKMEKKYFNFDKCIMSIDDAINKLQNYIDTSDPDVAIPNIEHMYQTAEGLRKAGQPDWMQLIGLLHDMGKIMYLWGTNEDGQEGTLDGDQWGLGGDTWIVGCQIPESIIFPEFNKLNPDYHNELLNNKYGIYKPNCGLENVKFAFGHDEYLYRMLAYNKLHGRCFIPDEGLLVIRYHSCYVWHTHNEYDHLMVQKDYKIKELVNEFNKCDLYTKNIDK